MYVYVYHIFFIHSSVDGFLGCFHILAVINNAAIGCMNLFDLVFSIFLYIYPGVEVLGCMVVLTFIFEKLPYCFQLKATLKFFFSSTAAHAAYGDSQAMR